jgi:hypothetical protein
MAADCATLSVYSGLLLRVHDGQNSGCYWLACVVVTRKRGSKEVLLATTAQSARHRSCKWIAHLDRLGYYTCNI